MLKRLILFLVFTVNSIGLVAQTTDEAFSLKDYVKIVLDSHPVVKQANLQEDFAKNARLRARGFFDPKLKARWNQKEFKGTNYFREGKTELEIPTTLGLSLKANYENNDGVFLNPNFNVPDNGLWAIGLEANLLQGLLMDERRAEIRKAKFFQTLSINERLIIINELLLLSYYTYNQWYTFNQIENVIDESLSLAQDYFSATKMSFEQGDKAAIDTLEAFLIYQDRLGRWQENRINIQESIQLMENFLWNNEQPLNLRQKSPEQPLEPNSASNYQGLQDIWVDQHPEIIKKELKISEMKIDLRLKKEKLKPKLIVNYSPLLNTTRDAFDADFDITDYKWSVDFSLPLLFRKERADVKLTLLKIRETELEILNKKNELRNKLEAIFQKIDILQEQYELQKSNVENYFRLLEGERTKFNFGESSVFLLNSREQKYLETKIKLSQIEMKLQNAFFFLLYSNGQILNWSNDFINP